MKIVHSYMEIKQNLLMLERYRKSPEENDRLEYKRLLSKGHCFVAYGAKKAVYFGPSRFIGYSGNTFAKHNLNEDKAGSETNNAIERVLCDKFDSMPLIEKKFKEYCSANGIQAEKRARKFIGTGALSLSKEDFIIDDVANINSRRNIQETEKRRLIDARIGQGDFRAALLRYWKKCPITGCRESVLLRASHIKPWRDASDIERLDVYNGLLLSPNLDSAFDAGLIGFTDKGKICVSKNLRREDAKSLGISRDIRVTLHKKHLPYIAHHLLNVFKE